MSDQETALPPKPGPTADHDWTPEEVNHQIEWFASRVIRERLSQEQRWGKQNVFDVQPGANGVHQVGRSYRSMAQIMKYECDRARSLGTESLDLILLEEVFEALEVAVAIQDAETPEERADLQQRLIEELVQVSAVAEKWAAITERDEPRHG